MRMPVSIVVLSLLLTPAFGRKAAGVPAPQDKADTPKPEQAELEKQFEKTMTGATLVGRFTVEGRGGDRGAERGGAGGREPREERYHIHKVTKGQGDYWTFLARVQYGNKDVTVPMPLQVKWAGDTPVITLTNLTIPTLGTYTARVLIYRDHYSGYWSGGDHSGHLWGRIERGGDGATDDAAAPDAPEPAAAPKAREAAKAPQPPAERK